ncbi:MAG: prepilin-type N-terminal cleavage/methylation domain-containing protein [Candidatus Gastranaerophilales bacterium]|nr:prepilin-type N-terminal cleavage/methylation domain-containing protein [Candidatus Gastranaerophilales bacterium]
MLNKMKQSENRFIKKLGFTLAETLIVIAIIGVIASIATPMLFGTTSDAELKAKWKKIYSDLSQAQLMIMNNNDGTMSGACTNHITYRDAFASYLNILKSCPTTDLAGNCWHSKEISGTHSAVLGDDVGTILNNGAFLAFDWDSNNCAATYGPGNVCGKIVIDVNGFKKPNKAGKDIFGVWTLADRLVPVGVQGDSSSYTCSDSGGISCSAEYLYK